MKRRAVLRTRFVPAFINFHSKLIAWRLRISIKNSINIFVEHVKIELTRGMVAFIDAEDYEKISRYKWYCGLQGSQKRPYARRMSRASEHGSGKRFVIWLHREIMGLPRRDSAQVCDHLNGDGLDNRKINLEVVSWDENQRRSNKKNILEEICL